MEEKGMESTNRPGKLMEDTHSKFNEKKYTIIILERKENFYKDVVCKRN